MMAKQKNKDGFVTPQHLESIKKAGKPRKQRRNKGGYSSHTSRRGNGTKIR